jgi:hypothetical protein
MTNYGVTINQETVMNSITFQNISANRLILLKRTIARPGVAGTTITGIRITTGIRAFAWAAT